MEGRAGGPATKLQWMVVPELEWDVELLGRRGPEDEAVGPDRDGRSWGEGVELPELAYDHSPLTLGDWFALVGPRCRTFLRELPSGGKAPWRRRRSFTRFG